MIVPNDNRVIVKRLDVSDQIKSSGLLVAGQLKAGENLFIGKVIHPGTTKFKKDQTVYYSEYSAAALYDLVGKTYAEAMKEPFFVVAEDDIMAFDDDTKVRATTKKS